MPKQDETILRTGKETSLKVVEEDAVWSVCAGDESRPMGNICRIGRDPDEFSAFLHGGKSISGSFKTQDEAVQAIIDADKERDK